MCNISMVNSRRDLFHYVATICLLRLSFNGKRDDMQSPVIDRVWNCYKYYEVAWGLWFLLATVTINQNTADMGMVM